MEWIKWVKWIKWFIYVGGLLAWFTVFVFIYWIGTFIF